MRIHFIAIGGAIMHNLAITLQKAGHHVSGSDDVIYDPAKSRLERANLLPEAEGWFPHKITEDLDLIILGKHARKGNPELEKATSLQLKIQSFPAYIFDASTDKKRVVVAGSHGKTTTTSMIMHVLRHAGRKMDYLVGAQLEGFEEMVKVSEADLIVLEGDEYPSSALDSTPKFLHYLPHLAIVTGIAWDHVNVFPTLDSYIEQFREFLSTIEEGGTLIYDESDAVLRQNVLEMERLDLDIISYHGFNGIEKEGSTFIQWEGKEYPVTIFGKHNFKNMQAAYYLCRELGIETEDFFAAMAEFIGASRRFQLLGESKSNRVAIYLDFAHAPSKVRASTAALVEKFKKKGDRRRVVICLELHTYSSLSKHFLPQYKGSLNGADAVLVYFNPHAIAIKKLEKLKKKDIVEAFELKNLSVANQKEEVLRFVEEEFGKNTVLCFMSSANFGGIDYEEYSEQLLSGL